MTVHFNSHRERSTKPSHNIRIHRVPIPTVSATLDSIAPSLICHTSDIIDIFHSVPKSISMVSEPVILRILLLQSHVLFPSSAYSLGSIGILVCKEIGLQMPRCPPNPPQPGIAQQNVFFFARACMRISACLLDAATSRKFSSSSGEIPDDQSQ
ncbi:hypothetical protein CW304_12040 [Bacillus sp. UFRGS-B20]|nr:hypothetical protein CW304_12040 [Bacillus sp. UFRGS-B20]